MDIARPVTQEGMTLVAIGSTMGLMWSAITARALEGFLIGLRAADMAVAASTILLFAMLGLLACLVPTIRALRIRATDALRAL